MESDPGRKGFELWKSDGTEVGTAIVKDINPGEPSTGISEPTDVRGTLYFVAHQHKRGNELWTSDGD